MNKRIIQYFFFIFKSEILFLEKVLLCSISKVVENQEKKRILIVEISIPEGKIEVQMPLEVNSTSF